MRRGRPDSAAANRYGGAASYVDPAACPYDPGGNSNPYADQYSDQYSGADGHAQADTDEHAYSLGDIDSNTGAPADRGAYGNPGTPDSDASAHGRAGAHSHAGADCYAGTDSDSRAHADSYTPTRVFLRVRRSFG